MKHCGFKWGESWPSQPRKQKTSNKDDQKETRQQRRHTNLPARFAFRQQRKQRNRTSLWRYQFTLHSSSYLCLAFPQGLCMLEAAESRLKNHLDSDHWQHSNRRAACKPRIGRSLQLNKLRVSPITPLHCFLEEEHCPQRISLDILAINGPSGILPAQPRKAPPDQQYASSHPSTCSLKTHPSDHHNTAWRYSCQIRSIVFWLASSVRENEHRHLIAKQPHIRSLISTLQALKNRARVLLLGPALCLSAGRGIETYSSTTSRSRPVPGGIDPRLLSMHGLRRALLLFCIQDGRM